MGYVLRRIIRRAVRFAYMLGVDRPVLPPMVEQCTEVMGEAYPDLVTNRDGDRHDDRPGGGAASARRWHAVRSSSTMRSTVFPTAATLDGAVAFELHDTYGFPLEVTQEMAELRGVEVDEPAFVAAMEAQRAAFAGRRQEDRRRRR